MTTQRSDSAVAHTADAAPKDMHDLADTAADKLKGATDRAQEVAGTLAEQAQIYGEKAQEIMGQVKPYLEKSIKEQPMTTLAVAAAIGVALGAMWKK